MSGDHQVAAVMFAIAAVLILWRAVDRYRQVTQLAPHAPLDAPGVRDIRNTPRAEQIIALIAANEARRIDDEWAGMGGGAA